MTAGGGVEICNEHYPSRPGEGAIRGSAQLVLVVACGVSESECGGPGMPSA